MHVGLVMDDVAAALATIDGLEGRTFAYPPPRIVPPSAWVEWPEIDYDLTMRRGGDRMTLQVRVLVGKADDRTARDEIAVFANGSGERSVKAVLQAHVPTAYGSARVTKCEFGTTSDGAVLYLSALFTLDIVGNGE